MDYLIDNFTMNSSELIKWCKMRKSALNMTNNKLSELSNVPIGTIDRILSGNYLEYKYSTIQPIVCVLKEKTGTVVNNENKSIEEYEKRIFEMNNLLDRLYKEIEYLSQENSNKQKVLDEAVKHIVFLEGLINKL